MITTKETLITLTDDYALTSALLDAYHIPAAVEFTTKDVVNVMVGAGESGSHLTFREQLWWLANSDADLVDHVFYALTDGADSIAEVLDEEFGYVGLTLYELLAITHGYSETASVEFVSEIYRKAGN